MHAWHTYREEVILRETADAKECGDHRDLSRFGELLQLAVSSRDNHPVPGDDNRPLGLRNELGRLFDLRGLTRQMRIIPRQLDGLWVFEVHLFLLDVLRDVD